MAKKILIIDDDVDFVEMNKAVLTKEGFEVKEAYNGTEGLELVKSEKPDLVILDVMMSRADEGFEVAREIRKDPKTRNLPIIMLTSVNQQPDYNWKFGPDEEWNPVDEFLEKPVSHDKLLQKVNDLLA